jgi:lipopolysaccharide export system protein LptA
VWQKRARLAVALVGVTCAGVVYFSMGEQHSAAPPPLIDRYDRNAIIETTGALWQRLSGREEDFEVAAKRSLTYADGSMRQFDVRITVRQRGGRDFVVTARQADAGPNERLLQLSGGVSLVASDGFELTTEAATYNQDEGIARVPGAATFHKGRMRGSGRRLAYDQHGDVLDVGEQARVTTTDDRGGTGMDFTAGAARLDRRQDLLSLHGRVLVRRGDGIIDADSATARLSENEEVVTYLELRGNARVVGGAADIEAMSAREIDLDYTDDGRVLQRVALRGGATIAMRGQDGRRIAGEAFELALAPDGSLTRLAGSGTVRLDLSASARMAASSITAHTLHGSGVEGRGLTSLTFTGDVEYRERSATPRVARSQALEVALVGDAIERAHFSGLVTFEDGELVARAADAVYDPDRGTLRLTGSDSRGAPHAADDQVAIDAARIDLTFAGPQIAAQGNVTASLRPPGRVGRRGADAGEPDRLPGLLQPGMPASVSAGALDYQGDAGRVVFTGGAALTQAETSIRADRLVVDRRSGDLVATGAASAVLVLDGGISSGSADKIRYADTRRIIAFEPEKEPESPPDAPTGKSAVPPAQWHTGASLTAPEGALRAGRIEIVLAKDANRAERLEAHTAVSLTVGARRVTGDRLTYYAAEERYEVWGLRGTPVKVVDGCREMTGRTLIFFRSAARIIVDGAEQTHTLTKSGGWCPESASAR